VYYDILLTLTLVLVQMIIMIYTTFSCITFFVFSPTLPPVVLVCGDLTPTERRDEILRILSTVSEPGSIETAGSPQQNAFDWIVDEDFTLKILCPYFTLLFHHNLGSPTFSLYFISLFHHILP